MDASVVITIVVGLVTALVGGGVIVARAVFALAKEQSETRMQSKMDLAELQRDVATLRTAFESKIIPTEEGLRKLVEKMINDHESHCVGADYYRVATTPVSIPQFPPRRGGESR